MPDAILSLDLGTTACKAVVFGLDGSLLGEAVQEYPTHHPVPGAAEQEADDWWAAAAGVGRLAVSKAGAATVIAIGLSSQRETIVPVDGAGRPLRRAITWLDRRAQPQAEQMAAAFGAEALHARTGMLPEATFSAAKIRWLQEHEPESLQRAAYLLQPKDCLLMRLTGAPALDPSLASRTLLWGLRDGWLADLVEWTGARPEQFPPVVPSGAAAGRLTPEAAAALGVRPGIPVAAGAGDRCCEALGAGVRPGGRGMLSTGTATNVSGAVDRLPDPLLSGILYTRHAVADQWLAEQGIGTGGSVLKWLRDTFGADGYEELEQAAAASPPGANGLILLPFFMGVRATRWNPAARGVWFGLSLGSSRGDLARSAMEGVACEVRACLEHLRRTGTAPAELVILGGGAGSELWCSIKADLTGLPVLVPRVPQAASLGAMLLAGQAAGCWSDPALRAVELNPPVRRLEPQPRLQRQYDRVYALYNRLYEAAAPLYSELASLGSAADVTQKGGTADA
jgi:xylulokinase